MGSFDDRKKLSEARYTRKSEHDFKVVMLRNRLIGTWAAKEMGHTDVDSYVQSVIEADFEQPGHEDVVRKLVKDLHEAGSDVSEHAVRLKMDQCLEEAYKETGGSPS